MGRKKHSDVINVHLFREILLIPFAIEPKNPKDQKFREGRALMNAVGALLDAKDSPWRRIDDRTRHVTDSGPYDGPQLDLRERVSAYEEYVFFEPYVQKFLFGHQGEAKDKPPMAIHMRPGINALEVKYPISGAGADQKEEGEEAKFGTFRFDVRRCNFYSFETGNAILAFEIEYDAGSSVNRIERPSINLSEVLHILEGLRRVFPPYYTPSSGDFTDLNSDLDTKYFPKTFKWIVDKCASDLDQSVADTTWQTMVGQVLGEKGSAPNALPLLQPWFDLLNPLPIEGYDKRAGKVQLSQMGDDRAFAIAQVGVDDAQFIRRADWIRLCFLDIPGGGYPYSPEFLDSIFDHRHCYDRYFSPSVGGWLSTRTLITDYSFVCVGTTASPHNSDSASDRHEPGPGAKENRDFFRHIISKHVRRHYFQLCLISYLQKMALLTLSERVASVIDDETNGNDNRFDRIQHDVHRLTHRYWFEQISSQIQAKELFEMLRSNMKTKELYEQLSQEIREASESAELKKQRELAEAAQQLNRTAIVGLGATVFVGIFGMNIFGSQESGDHLNLDVSGAMLVVVALLVAGGFWGILHFGKQLAKTQIPKADRKASALLPVTKWVIILTGLIFFCGFLL